MRLPEKIVVVEALRSRFSASPLVVLAGFKGSTVLELQAVRRSLQASGLHFEVVKNTLCQRALADTSLRDLGDRFAGNIAVVFSAEDPVASAKALRDVLRTSPKIEVRCGYFDGAVISAEEVGAVADLPSREQLLAGLLGVIIAGPRQVLGVLQAPARDLVNVLSNRAAQLEEQS